MSYSIHPPDAMPWGIHVYPDPNQPGRSPSPYSSASRTPPPVPLPPPLPAKHPFLKPSRIWDPLRHTAHGHKPARRAPPLNYLDPHPARMSHLPISDAVRSRVLLEVRTIAKAEQKMKKRMMRRAAREQGGRKGLEEREREKLRLEKKRKAGKKVELRRSEDALKAAVKQKLAAMASSTSTSASAGAGAAVPIATHSQRHTVPLPKRKPSARQLAHRTIKDSQETAAALEVTAPAYVATKFKLSGERGVRHVLLIRTEEGGVPLDTEADKLDRKRRKLRGNKGKAAAAAAAAAKKDKENTKAPGAPVEEPAPLAGRKRKRAADDPTPARGTRVTRNNNNGKKGQGPPESSPTKQAQPDPSPPDEPSPPAKRTRRAAPEASTRIMRSQAASNQPPSSSPPDDAAAADANANANPIFTLTAPAEDGTDSPTPAPKRGRTRGRKADNNAKPAKENEAAVEQAMPALVNKHLEGVTRGRRPSRQSAARVKVAPLRGRQESADSAPVIPTERGGSPAVKGKGKAASLSVDAPRSASNGRVREKRESVVPARYRGDDVV